MKNCKSINAAGTMYSINVGKKILRLSLLILIIVACFSAGAQKTSAHAFFSLINFGHKTQGQLLPAEGKAILFYAADTLSGEAVFDGDVIVFRLSRDTAQRKFEVTDNNLKEVQLDADGAIVSFVRKANEPKLFRVLFNAYGLKIYDDVLSSKIETGNINYSELLFEFDGKTYPAVSFWTTSTKRSMIKILNNIFRLSLQPDEFKNKEAVMAAVLNYDNRIFPSTK